MFGPALRYSDTFQAAAVLRALEPAVAEGMAVQREQQERSGAISLVGDAVTATMTGTADPPGGAAAVSGASGGEGLVERQPTAQGEGVEQLHRLAGGSVDLPSTPDGGGGGGGGGNASDTAQGEGIDQLHRHAGDSADQSAPEGGGGGGGNVVSTAAERAPGTVGGGQGGVKEEEEQEVDRVDASEEVDVAWVQVVEEEEAQRSVARSVAGQGGGAATAAKVTAQSSSARRHRGAQRHLL